MLADDGLLERYMTRLRIMGMGMEGNLPWAPLDDDAIKNLEFIWISMLSFRGLPTKHPYTTKNIDCEKAFDQWVRFVPIYY